jgi:hypothetical protein
MFWQTALGQRWLQYSTVGSFNTVYKGREFSIKKPFILKYLFVGAFCHEGKQLTYILKSTSNSPQKSRKLKTSFFLLYFPHLCMCIRFYYFYLIYFISFSITIKSITRNKVFFKLFLYFNHSKAVSKTNLYW